MCMKTPGLYLFFKNTALFMLEYVWLFYKGYYKP